VKSGTKDAAKLLLTAVGIVALCFVLLVVTVKFEPQWFSHRLNWKWIRFSVVTIWFVFFCIKGYWQARRHIAFWAILGSMLMLHLFGVGYFYYAGDGLPLLLFGPVVALEWALMAFVIFRTLHIQPDLKEFKSLSMR